MVSHIPEDQQLEPAKGNMLAAIQALRAVALARITDAETWARPHREDLAYLVDALTRLEIHVAGLE